MIRFIPRGDRFEWFLENVSILRSQVPYRSSATIEDDPKSWLFLQSTSKIDLLGAYIREEEQEEQRQQAEHRQWRSKLQNI